MARNRSSTKTTNVFYIHPNTAMTPPITPTQKTPKLATADRRTHTASNHLLSTKPPSHVRTTVPMKHTLDLQKTTSRLDTETTPHHSDTQNTETLPNSANIWILKENNINHFISKRILSSRSPNNSANKRCNLSFIEKLLIIRPPELSSLNKRDELVSSCRNRNKALLRNNWTKHLN